MNWEVITKRNIAWDQLETLQENLRQKVLQNPQQGFLLFSEPQPTFTFGRHSTSQDLLWNSQLLLEKKVAVAAVTRGGQWTYHGPGQILCYPIVCLASLGFSSKSARNFVEILRTSVFDLLTQWEVPVSQQDEPFGLFVDHRKLVSFGLSFEQGISSHGLALYLSSQEPYFSGINPCGKNDHSVSNLQSFLPACEWDVAARALANSIEKGFKIL